MSSVIRSNHVFFYTVRVCQRISLLLTGWADRTTLVILRSGIEIKTNDKWCGQKYAVTCEREIETLSLPHLPKKLNLESFIVCQHSFIAARLTKECCINCFI